MSALCPEDCGVEGLPFTQRLDLRCHLHLFRIGIARKRLKSGCDAVLPGSVFALVEGADVCYCKLGQGLYALNRAMQQRS